MLAETGGPKLAAKRELLLLGDVLITEEEDEMLHEGGMDRIAHVRGERVAGVHAPHLGTDRGGERHHVHRA